MDQGFGGGLKKGFLGAKASPCSQLDIGVVAQNYGYLFLWGGPYSKAYSILGSICRILGSYHIGLEGSDLRFRV